MEHIHLYSCPRCGYETTSKSNLSVHFKRIKSCNPILSDIPYEELHSLLIRPKHNNKCNICGKQYTNRHSLSRHKKDCAIKQSAIKQSVLREREIKNAKSELNELKEREIKNAKSELNELKEIEIDHLKKELNELKRELQQNSKAYSNNLLELQYYKNRKHEKFFQQLLEVYLGGGHKKLSCGETDVTTEDLHAEIKEWKCWKEAVGQLTCYNKADPKARLAIYVFGNYRDSCKLDAYSIIKDCGFELYEFKETMDGEVYIENFSNKEKQFSYFPSIR